MMPMMQPPMPMQQPQMPPPLPQLPPNLQQLMKDPEQMQELMDAPTWDDVETLLRDDALLTFKVDIETDSTMKQDEDIEKASRMELLGVVGKFVEASQQVQDPTSRLFLVEMLGFAVRGFKAGKQIEGAIEQLTSQVQKAASNPQPQQPSPEQIEAEGKMKIAQMQADAQAANDKRAADNAILMARLKEETAQHQARLDDQRNAAKMQMERDASIQEMNNKVQMHKYETDQKAALARESARQKHQVNMTVAQGKDPDAAPDTRLDDVGNVMMAVHQTLQSLHKAYTTPKKIITGRDQQGNLFGHVVSGE